MSGCGVPKCLDIGLWGICVPQQGAHALEYPGVHESGCGVPCSRSFCLQEWGVHVLGRECPGDCV